MLSISSLKPMIRLQMSFTVFITLITTECIHGEFVCLVIYVVCLKDRLTNSRERLVPATANQQEEPFSVLHHWRSNRWSRWTEWWRKEYTWRKKKEANPYPLHRMNIMFKYIFINGQWKILFSSAQWNPKKSKQYLTNHKSRRRKKNPFLSLFVIKCLDMITIMRSFV